MLNLLLTSFAIAAPKQREVSVRRALLTLSVSLGSFAMCFAPYAQAQSPNPTVNRWSRTADLTAPRAQACSAVLHDGRLLVIGGLGDKGPVTAVDIYGADGSFNAGAPMNQARALASCTTLSDGRVLVAGGDDGSGALSSAEIFDPAAGTWQVTGSLSSAREGHQAALMPWGAVFVAGGTNAGAIVGAVELYGDSKFQTAGTLNTPRTGFAMTPLGPSKVLFAGGSDGNVTLDSVEIYNGFMGTQITVAGTMSQARKNFAAATLLDGTVLMTGGLDAKGKQLGSTEIFDPVKGTSTAGPALLQPRSHHTAYVLPNNGSVMIHGGQGAAGALSSSEVYTFATGGITLGNPLSTGRSDETRANLRPGSYMVAGGRDASGLLASSELYRYATIVTDKGDYAPGTAVKITGGGFLPGEQVQVVITAFPTDQHRTEFTAAAMADGNGNITVPGFAVDKSHLNEKFLITATGSQSLAQETFTDAVNPGISITFNPASGAPGAAVDVTFTFTPANGSMTTPQGSIEICSNSACPSNLTVTADPGFSCTNHFCALNGAGLVKFTVIMPAGPTLIGLAYSGDGNYNPDAGNSIPGDTATFNAQNSTTTDLLSGPSGSVPFGTTTPYIANVYVVSGTLTGTVAFLSNGSPIPGCTAVTLTGTTSPFSASCVPNPPLAVGGPYVITATYSGDAGNAGSTSTASNGGAASISTTILAATSTVLTATSDNSPGATEFGRTVTLTAVTTTTTPGATLQPKATAISITPPAGNSSNSTCGTPTAGATTPTSVTVSCKFVVTGLASGTNPASVTANAAYAGDNVIGTAASTATALAIPVTKATTVTTVSVSAVPDLTTAVQLGRLVTLTAVASTLNNGSGVLTGPAGSFTFTLPANTFASAACGTVSSNNFTQSATTVTVPAYLLAGGNQASAAATCTFIVVPPAPGTLGADALSVVYNGDSATLSTTASVPFKTQLNTSQFTTILDTTSVFACTSTNTTCTVNTPQTYVYGQNITLNAVLTSTTTLPNLGAGFQPNQSITFSGNGLSYTVPVVPTPTGGTFSISSPANVPSIPPPGTYTLNVNYGNDPDYGPSSTQVTFTIGKANTATTVMSLATTVAGQPNLKVAVNFVAPGFGTPTGTVQVMMGSSLIQTGTLSPASGSNCPSVSPCAVASFVVTPNSYTASYPGDANFNGSTSSAQAVQAVPPASSTITLIATPNPPPPGQPVTFTATVNGTNGSGTPTGTVTFTDNGAIVSVSTLISGVATFVDSSLTPGSHTIGAQYNGDTTYPSASANYGILVNKPAATTSFSSNLTTSVLGQQVTLTVKFSNSITGGSVPTGTVQFLDNGVPIGSPVTIAGGAAALSLTALPPGVNNIGVQYSGDGSFSNLTKNVGMVTVNQAQVTTTLTSTTSGNQMTLTATVAVVAPGAGTPTGTVQFVDSVTKAVLGTATLAGGVATLTVPVTGDPIVAVYSGDSNFLTSTSASSATISLSNAASYAQNFAPGEIVTVFGAALTTQTVYGSLPLGTSLGGVTVTVTDSAGVPRQGVLFYVSATQLSFLIPGATAVGAATVTVTTAAGSLTAGITIVPSTAGLFTANANGQGPLAAQVVSSTPSGQQTYTNTATTSGTTFVNAPISLQPAADTFYLLLYGTGFDNAKSVTVTINGQTFTPAYFGPQGTFAGLDQVNVLLPASLAGAGQVNVSITVDGQTSNVGTIAFASAGTN